MRVSRYLSSRLRLSLSRFLGRHWRGVIAILDDHQLIRSGPYRLVRHSIYAAIMGMFVGTAMISGRLSALLGLIRGPIAH